MGVLSVDQRRTKVPGGVSVKAWGIQELEVSEALKAGWKVGSEGWQQDGVAGKVRQGCFVSAGWRNLCTRTKTLSW